MWTMIITILGLVVFEVISSVDNAIVNAHVLKTLPERFRKIFLIWGLLLAVFVIRGVLPFLIVWLSNPTLHFVELINFVFSGSNEITESVEQSKGLLLLGGGVYLVLVFFSWLFLEEKKYAFLVENFIHRQSVWFYAFASIFFTGVIYFALKLNPLLALAASIGSTAFFITDGFKKNAERKEQELLNPMLGAWSKIMYLEVIDATFSIDGILGAFAFTFILPLILIGNGIGALVVRQLTISNIERVKRYKYLKNGAMYSILALGTVMLLHAFDFHIPEWLSPAITFVIIGYFFWKSIREIKANPKAA